MKANKFLTLILTIATSFAIVSCVQDDDYTVPTSLGNEENAGLTQIMDDIASGALTEISIAELKALFVGQTALIESDIVVKGYVSSSDLTGNFYKEFYMQDKPENPTAGIGVVLNQVDSYNQFNQGREVYIKLKGLYLGENSSDVVSIGGQVDANFLDEMTIYQISTHVFRSPTTIPLVPVNLDPSAVDDSHLGIYATLSNVQIPLAYDGMTFHSPTNDFDTRYPLVSCVNGSSIQMETSSFANFKQEPLPTDGRGSISGVITQGFGGSPRVLVLNTTDDIDFNESRCDPVFEESFNSAIDNTILNLPGWINFAEAGSVVWTEQVFRGNGYAELNPFSSGDSSNIAWLITPGIDLSAQDDEVLTFQTEHAYPDSGHDPLSVLISTDFDGTESGISSATWTELTFDVSYIVDFGNWYNFTNSGEIDISGYSGTAYIAFRYTGSDTSNQNMTLHVENVTVSVP
ncbi:DUF5689 domain-containing protein [Yeosuana sp. MJ-SS3]|jgi:hypothetical protein|uniref:DUF5689 domain-containing protein n=1 Tax=Gilvirhabdus luticola TaxID=3079858 RepID=A0ABU3U381_9FLAO|nr:DUF5689 domain-containing protein [Yeosuana sp. MJ-SS3]MDU8884858.1 DUF5689 domain-containing protein [Yeosuana sp. MJ-SS3]